MHRKVGRIIAPMRRRVRSQDGMLPGFLVVGTKRGGSSSLYQWIARHPAVAPCRGHKGTHYFDVNHERGWDWFRSMFEPAGESGVLTGEASPYYMFHPLAPQRIARELPDARLLVVLRDPVARAWSHYRYEHGRGKEPLEFVAALDAEAERLAGEEERLILDEHYVSDDHRYHSYLQRGRYAEQLQRLRALMPGEQIHVVQSEQLFAKPDEVLQGVWRFLGLEDVKLTGLEPHKQGSPRDLSDTARRQLQEYYKPLNDALYAEPGIDFSWGDRV